MLGSPSALAFAGELGRVPEPEPARLPEPLRDPDPERELRRGFAGCDPASDEPGAFERRVDGGRSGGAARRWGVSQ